MRLPVLPKVELEEDGEEVVVGLGGGIGSIPSIDPQNLEQPQEMLDLTRKYWLLEIFGIDHDLIFCGGILLVAPVRGDEEDVAAKLNVIHLALT